MEEVDRRKSHDLAKTTKNKFIIVGEDTTL
jgi:hypothetical protein